MMPQVFAHEGEATGSGMMLPNMMGGTEGATFTHFMGDMMSFHWGNWSPFLITLWWLTWILIVVALVVFIRWLWLRGGKSDESQSKR